MPYLPLPTKRATNAAIDLGAASALHRTSSLIELVVGWLSVGVTIPPDLPGIARGKPLDKIGQRALPQGKVGLDNAKRAIRFAVALQEVLRQSGASLCNGVGRADGLRRGAESPEKLRNCPAALVPSENFRSKSCSAMRVLR
jgi:hypothetical protein